MIGFKGMGELDAYGWLFVGACVSVGLGLVLFGRWRKR